MSRIIPKVNDIYARDAMHPEWAHFNRVVSVTRWEVVLEELTCFAGKGRLIHVPKYWLFTRYSFCHNMTRIGVKRIY